MAGRIWRALLAAEQAQITAIHEGKGVVDQAVCATAGGRILPFCGRKDGLHRADHLGRDVARAATGGVDVMGEQQQDEMCSLKRRELQGAREQGNASALKPMNEARSDVEAQLTGAVGWEDHGQALRRVGVGQPDVEIA